MTSPTGFTLETWIHISEVQVLLLDEMNDYGTLSDIIFYESGISTQKRNYYFKHDNFYNWGVVFFQGELKRARRPDYF